MPEKGTRTVGEPEPGVRRNADHVGPVVAPIGHQRDAVEPGQLGQTVGHGQIGVSHQHLVGAEGGQSCHPRLHGPVQAASRFGQRHGSVPDGPRCDLGVVADDGHRERSGRLEDAAGHHPGELGPPVGVQRRRQTGLAGGEGLHGDEDNATGEAGDLGRLGRHGPSVRPPWRSTAGAPRRRVGGCSTRSL